MAKKELSMSDLIVKIEEVQEQERAILELKKELKSMKKLFENEKILALLGEKKAKEKAEKVTDFVEKPTDFEDKICSFYSLYDSEDREKFLEIMLNGNSKNYFENRRYEVSEWNSDLDKTE